MGKGKDSLKHAISVLTSRLPSCLGIFCAELVANPVNKCVLHDFEFFADRATTHVRSSRVSYCASWYLSANDLINDGNFFIVSNIMSEHCAGRPKAAVYRNAPDDLEYGNDACENVVFSTEASELTFQMSVADGSLIIFGCEPKKAADTSVLGNYA